MDEDWCYQALRRCRWPDGLVCVVCASRKVTIHTRSKSTPRLKYLCLDCHRGFSDLTGTIFARSNLPLRTWFLGLSLLAERLSTAEYASALRVKWDTARRLVELLRSATARPGLVRDLQLAVNQPAHSATER